MKLVVRSSINPPEIMRVMMASTCDRSSIFASITSKDITKNMVRAKSSNIWSYAINVRNSGDNTGDMYIQFKGKNGGPDDIYVYYDVPIKIYRRFITSTSKGHSFWKLIRNNYKYSKLTGNKKGVLPNAINR